MRRSRVSVALGFTLAAAMAASSCSSATSSPPGAGGADSGAGGSGTGGSSSGGSSSGGSSSGGADAAAGSGGMAPDSGTPDAGEPDAQVDGSSWPTNLCGNGVLDEGEQCDPTAPDAGVGCLDVCYYACTPDSPDRCSDGNFCNGEETCSADHVCQKAAAAMPDGTLCGESHKCKGGKCQLADAICGDGLKVPPTEECEDGNTVNGDGCDNCRYSCLSTDPTRDCRSADPCGGRAKCNDGDHTCTPGTPLSDYTVCGDAKVCIAGVCSTEYCSNGKLEGTEECDDGNRVGGDGCEPDCTFSCKKGDTTRDCHSDNPCIQNGTCDDVTHKCSPVTPKAPGTSCAVGKNCIAGNCVSPVCGDGIRAAGMESCDDGNRVSGDGCDNDCTVSCIASTVATDCAGATPACRAPTCAADACSSIADTSKDGSSCTMGTGQSGTCAGGRCGTCGNGTTDAGEQCDDGNTTPRDGCEIDCTYTCATNGDCDDQDACSGAETCDTSTHTCTNPANLADGTTCGSGKLCMSGSCRPSFCGDGITDTSRQETCDPPNTAVCDSQCKAVVTCDLTGDWAMKVSVDVTWGEGAALEPGTGTIQQWASLKITQSGTAVSVSLRPCGLDIPDFQTNPTLGSEWYGLTFPDAAFNASSIPSFAASGTVSSLAPGATFELGSAAIMLGYTVASPATPFDAWPSFYSAAEVPVLEAPPGYTFVDAEGDGALGITATVKTGSIPGKPGVSYQDIIADLTNGLANPLRADRMYIAIRQIASQSGKVDSKCTTIQGTTSALIDNHIIGCHLDTGVECTSGLLGDVGRPIYTPTGSTFVAKKLSGPGTCATVRSTTP